MEESEYVRIKTYTEWKKKVQLMKSNWKVKGWLYDLDHRCKAVEDYALYLYEVTKTTDYSLIYRSGEFSRESVEEIRLTERARNMSRRCYVQLSESVKQFAVQYLETKRTNYREEKFDILRNDMNTRLHMIDDNIIHSLNQSRKTEQFEEITAETVRELRLYHNFTGVKFTDSEELIIQSSAGDVLQGSGGIRAADITGYVKELIYDVLLNYSKIVCGNRLYGSNVAKPTLREITRYLSHPAMGVRHCDFIYNVLSEVKSYELGFNPSLYERIEEREKVDRMKYYITMLKNRKGVIVRESDKKLGWSINSSEWYMSEYTRQLSSDKYSKVDCVTGVDDKIKHIVRTYGEELVRLKRRVEMRQWISKDVWLRLMRYKLRELTVPYMNILPKVHKLSESASQEVEKNLTGRPIITAFAWCNVELSKLIQQELRGILASFKVHMLSLGMSVPTIDSPTKYMTTVDSLVFTSLDGYFFVTFDFRDLYTNILYHYVELSLKSVCSILGITESRCSYILGLYELYCQYNYFRFGVELYKQEQGLSMGSYCSVEVSDIVLLYSEYQFLLTVNLNEEGIMLLKRYIDDGSFIMQTSEFELLRDMLVKLFLFYPSNLEITVTINRVRYIFLDQEYRLDDLALQTNHLHRLVYFKPYHTFSYISFASNHHKRIKANLIKNECIRYARICTNKEDYDHTCNLLRCRLRKLHYKRSFLQQNLVNYDDICRTTLRYMGSKKSRVRGNNGLILTRVMFDRKYRVDRKIVGIIQRASLKSRLDVRVSILHCLQPKLRELVCTRRSLHKTIERLQTYT